MVDPCHHERVLTLEGSIQPKLLLAWRKLGLAQTPRRLKPTRGDNWAHSRAPLLLTSDRHEC
jgi:hypothetical protein